MIPLVYPEEGLEFLEVFEAGDDHGLGWLNRRVLQRRPPLLQSIAVSLAVHLAVAAICVFTLRNADPVRSPWFEVQLVSLSSEGTASEAEGNGSSAGASVMGRPAGEAPPAAELFPPVPPLPAVAEPREKEPKPATNAAPARLHAMNKPREPLKTPLPRKESREVVPSSAATSPSADRDAAGSTAPSQAPGEFGEGTSGAVGGTHGKGPHGGHGGGPVDAEFGAGNGPRFAHRVLPKYPRLARQLGKEGTVVLRVTIDESGRPIAVEAIKTAGVGFDEEAVKAVKASLFHPAKREGKPVICRAILPIRFELGGSE